jgi:hypothetical protein
MLVRLKSNAEGGDENYARAALGFILSQSQPFSRERLTFSVMWASNSALSQCNALESHSSVRSIIFICNSLSLCDKSATTAECLLPSLAESMHLLALGSSILLFVNLFYSLQVCRHVHFLHQ